MGERLALAERASIVARVRLRIRELLSASRASELLVIAAAGAALLSAVWGARLAFDRMDTARDYYAELDDTQREREIELALGFDSELWRRLRLSIRADDRFAVVSDAFEQHEVRNYASYVLLPAVQVADVGEADVVLYWADNPPPDVRCARLADNVCLERRDS